MKEKEWSKFQLTKEQAIAIGESKCYLNWSVEDVVEFQMFQEKACMEFWYFHQCVEKVLGHPVFTTELLGIDILMQKHRKGKPIPEKTFFVNLIPTELCKQINLIK